MEDSILRDINHCWIFFLSWSSLEVEQLVFELYRRNFQSCTDVKMMYRIVELLNLIVLFLI